MVFPRFDMICGKKVVDSKVMLKVVYEKMTSFERFPTRFVTYYGVVAFQRKGC